MGQDEETRSATRSASSHLDIPDPSAGISPLSVRDMVARYRAALATAKWNRAIVEYLAARRAHSADALSYADESVRPMERAFREGTLKGLPHDDRDDAMMAYHIGTTALALSEFLADDVTAVLADPVRCLRSSK